VSVRLVLVISMTVIICLAMVLLALRPHLIKGALMMTKEILDHSWKLSILSAIVYVVYLVYDIIIRRIG
jgi:hypothetical protein